MSLSVSFAGSLIIPGCLIAFWLSGCATSRAVYFTSEPHGTTVNIPHSCGDEPEHRAMLSLPTGEHREVCLAGDGRGYHNADGMSSDADTHAQARFRMGRAASTTCRILAAPLLMAGAAGMWFVERSSSEDDENDSACAHQRREICILSIGSFLAGSMLYYISQNLDDMMPSPEPPPQIHAIFSDPNSQASDK